MKTKFLLNSWIPARDTNPKEKMALPQIFVFVIICNGHASRRINNKLRWVKSVEEIRYTELSSKEILVKSTQSNDARTSQKP